MMLMTMMLITMMRRTMMLMTMMRMEKVDHMAGESNDVDDHDENLRMESLGDPGASCLSTVSSSSSVNSVLPPRLLCMYLQYDHWSTCT